MQKLSPELIVELFEKYLGMAKEELYLANHGNLDETLAGKEFSKKFGQYIGVNLSEVFDMLNYDPDKFSKLVSAAQNSQEFMKTVLVHEIGPKVSLNPLVYSSNNHDLFEMTDTTQIGRAHV